MAHPDDPEGYELGTLVNDLMAALETPQGDITMLRSDVRAVLARHQVISLAVTGQVMTLSTPDQTVTITDPGERAMVVPRFDDPEIQAMAGACVFLDELRISAGAMAVRRAIGWLSSRFSADEMDRADGGG